MRGAYNKVPVLSGQCQFFNKWIYIEESNNFRVLLIRQIFIYIISSIQKIFFLNFRAWQREKIWDGKWGLVCDNFVVFQLIWLPTITMPSHKKSHQSDQGRPALAHIIFLNLFSDIFSSMQSHICERLSVQNYLVHFSTAGCADWARNLIFVFFWVCHSHKTGN